MHYQLVHLSNLLTFLLVEKREWRKSNTLVVRSNIHMRGGRPLYRETVFILQPRSCCQLFNCTETMLRRQRSGCWYRWPWCSRGWRVGAWKGIKGGKDEKKYIVRLMRVTRNALYHKAFIPMREWCWGPECEWSWRLRHLCCPLMSVPGAAAGKHCPPADRELTPTAEPVEDEAV